SQITLHWFENNTRFWYRNDLRGGAKEFIVVDVNRGVRQAAFDHQKLAGALSKAAGAQYQAERLPFDGIEFIDRAKVVRFRFGEVSWNCDLASYACSRSEAAPSPNDRPANPDPAPVAQEEMARLESPWPDQLTLDSDESPQQKAQPRGECQQREDRSRISPD